MLQLHINRTGGLIEHEDWSIAKYFTGDGDSLSLSTTQSHPALSNDCVQPIRQQRKEFIDASDFNRRAQFFCTGIRFTDFQVELDCIVE